MNEPDQIRIRLLGSALEDLLNLFDDIVDVPERNCFCHLSPPCSDCTDWGWARDVRKNARECIASLSDVNY